ncbi:hypothetical protein BU16DRAFT_564502 [Lophium mytilinum]|uniref:Uncharacterized protein n=1 Tax=Lophium mytilinum TaxID=390894 RepID=A0A6A6QII2_9PEZI|nr:hypothetical protein BU16DRAFT_564502 [Lophium mytilinum]
MRMLRYQPSGTVGFVVRVGEGTQDIYLFEGDTHHTTSLPICSCRSPMRQAYCDEPDAHYGILDNIRTCHYSPFGVFKCPNKWCAGHPWPQNPCYGEACVFFWHDGDAWEKTDETRDSVLQQAPETRRDKWMEDIDEMWSILRTEDWTVDGHYTVKLHRRMRQLTSMLKKRKENEERGRGMNDQGT